MWSCIFYKMEWMQTPKDYLFDCTVLLSRRTKNRGFLVKVRHMIRLGEKMWLTNTGREKRKKKRCRSSYYALCLSSWFFTSESQQPEKINGIWLPVCSNIVMWYTSAQRLLLFHTSFQLYKDIFASALKSGYDFLWILATESNKLLPAISVVIYTT